MIGIFKSTAVAVLVVAGGAGVALAEYPERPIEMVVAYGAGGGTDIAARTLVPYLEKYLGGDAHITVVNKPGAGGEIGFTELSQAKPDGYTIGFINTPNLVTIPIQREARYSVDSFSPIANMIYDPGAFVAAADGEYKTLDELVAYAKDHPGELTYGTTGIGGDDHLAMLNFERIAGVKLTHVPFPGSAEVRSAILGGHIQLASINISEVIDDVEEGTLVALGQMADKPWEQAPDVPTFKDQGFDIIMGSARGLAAPAGVPDDLLAKLQEASQKALEDPEFQKAAASQRLPLEFMSGADFQADLQQQDKSFRAIWQEEPWIKE